MRDNTHIMQMRFAIEGFNADLDFLWWVKNHIEIVDLAVPAS